MRAPHSERTAPTELPAIAADILQRLRERRPRVHCITNAVAQTFTANMLLAVGAVPSMTIALTEVKAFAARADALLINLGTFDPERQKASLAAIGVANKAGIPWVLDPVFIDRSPPRAAFAKKLVALKPRALRLNRGRICHAVGGRNAEAAGEAALVRYAKAKRTVVGLTGETRSGLRRRAPGHHRQRSSADGARHGDGLRCLGAGRRDASRSSRMRGRRSRRRSS